MHLCRMSFVLYVLKNIIECNLRGIQNGCVCNLLMFRQVGHLQLMTLLILSVQQRANFIQIWQSLRVFCNHQNLVLSTCNGLVLYVPGSFCWLFVHRKRERRTFFFFFLFAEKRTFLFFWCSLRA